MGPRGCVEVLEERKIFRHYSYKIQYNIYNKNKLIIKIYSTTQSENCALLGHYAASSDNFFKSLTPENGTDRLSRKVDNKL
jgi:hypothetical protein